MRYEYMREYTYRRPHLFQPPHNRLQIFINTLVLLLIRPPHAENLRAPFWTHLVAMDSRLASNHVLLGVVVDQTLSSVLYYVMISNFR